MSVLWSSVMHCGTAKHAGPGDHDERLVVLGRLDAGRLRVRDVVAWSAGAARLLHDGEVDAGGR